MSDVRCQVEELLGKTLTGIGGASEGSECVALSFSDGSMYRLEHDQDCCESVCLVDITGDIRDLIGEPLTMAELVTSDERQDGKPEYSDSFTWSFYKFATTKGYVTFRWLGESNGYYGEEVDLIRSREPMARAGAVTERREGDDI